MIVDGKLRNKADFVARRLTHIWRQFWFCGSLAKACEQLWHADNSDFIRNDQKQQDENDALLSVGTPGYYAHYRSNSTMHPLELLTIIVLQSEVASSFPVELVGDGVLTVNSRSVPHYEPIRVYAASLFALKEEAKIVTPNWIAVLVSRPSSPTGTGQRLTRLINLRQKLLNYFGSRAIIAFENSIEECKSLQAAERIIVDFEVDLEDLRQLLIMEEQNRVGKATGHVSTD